MKQKSFNLTAILLFLALNATTGQTTPNLGSTARFALFTATGAFNELAISSSVTGDVSTNAGAFAAFPPGTLYGSKWLPGSAEAVQAATDVMIAYSDLNQGGATIPAVLDGLNLTPGVYTVATAASMGANGVLTLDGQGNPQAIFIIRIGGAFAMASNSTILLTNAASLSKVFWQINGQFDVGSYASFRGTAIVNGAINLLESSTLDGRALSTAGAISLYNTNVSIPTHFRSRVTGNWDATGTWESSADSISWTNAVVIPSYDAVSVSISNAHTVTITGRADASVLTITPGAHLTLADAQTLSADVFTISSDIAGGAGTYVTNGTTLATYTKVKQQLTTGRNWYVSSPVESATASSINLFTGTFMVTYDEPHGSTQPWPTASSTLTPLKGYIAVSPVSVNPTISFAGTLNDGTQSIVLTRTTGQTKEGFNLVGNPYPSHLSWTQAIATSANVLSTLWYRTFVGSDYEFYTYNTEGKVGVPATTTGMIPPMQAFWVRVNAGGGTLTLNNTNRLHDLSSNRLKAPASVGTNEPERMKVSAASNQPENLKEIDSTNKPEQMKVPAASNQLVRLQVSNGTNASEAVVYFNENATVGFDSYDSPIMSNNNIHIPELYTMAGSEKVIINGLPAIVPDQEIPLGFMTLSANDFTIRANELTYMPANIQLILADKSGGANFDLTAGDAYRFSSEITNTLNRFSLIFRSTATITADNSAELSTNFQIFANSNHQIVISTANALPENTTVTVVNAMGQQLIHQRLAGSTTTLLPSLEPGIYFVKLSGANRIKKLLISSKR